MIRVLCFCVAAGAVSIAAASRGALPLPARLAPHSIALTFDDLPYVDALGGHDLGAATRATDRILQTLRRHHAAAIGFVNEAKLQVGTEADARTALLAAWVDSGMTLGNHTYDHADYDTVSIATYEDEIARGDVVTRRLMARAGHHQLYFRSPENHTGDTPEKRAALNGFLTARGYKLTPYTVENQDFLFNRAYARARLAGDSAQARRVAQAYVDFTIATLSFAETIAPRIFQRDIPQTLLLHANDLNADYLPVLLDTIESRGYRTISLDEAMADPAYATPDSLVTRFGPSWLWRWMKSKGMAISFAGDPEPPAWVAQAAAGQ